MGLFSIYTGLLYNECFSVPLNVFGSQWTINYTEHTVLDNRFLQLNPETHFSASPYPFGFDPVWKVSFTSPNFEVLLIASCVLFD
jgi:V-type H+-transporting ATPase subunit a